MHIATNPQMYKGVGCGGVGWIPPYKVISNFEETIILLSVTETFSSCLIMIIFHGHLDDGSNMASQMMLFDIIWHHSQ